MTAIKASHADHFIASLDRRIRAVLVYGSDSGLVAERARAVAQRLAGQDPPGEILRIEDTDLDSEPDRLLVEVQTIPMFGGAKVVHTRASRRVSADLLKPLVEKDALAAALVVEAGNLRPTDALRLIFEKSGLAAAIPCYADEARDLGSLVRDTLKDAHLTITPEAQEALIARLGADRILSRGELEKLVLYARGKTQIDIDDVDAVVGDASELAIEKAVVAAASGKPGMALVEYDRVVSSGESPQAVISAIQRYFLRLHRLRTEVAAGRLIDDLIRQIRPPIHFKARPALEAHCRTWSEPALRSALSQIADAAKAARLNPALESALAERLLLDLAGITGGRSAAS